MEIVRMQGDNIENFGIGNGFDLFSLEFSEGTVPVDGVLEIVEFRE